ncbi:MAG: transporter substrate-binding domain-containing protein [Pseudomonadota bacterium]
MNDVARENTEFIEEVSVLKQKIHELEQPESKRKRVETAYSLALLVMIVVMLFAAALANGACNAAGSSSDVHIGSELEFPPYAFADENGRPTGFSVELIKAVTDSMGLSIKISTGPWDTMWNALVSGQLDVLPIVAKLPERQHLVDFSLPHTETFDAFFVRMGDPPIRDIAAARGKEIVVMRSDAAHHALLERNFQGKLILVDTIPAGLELISSGKHGAFLCSKLIGALAIKEHGITGLTAGPLIPDYERVFSFAVKKGNAELLEKLNQGLLIVKTNGEYKRIYDKWLSADDPWRKVQKYLLPTIITVIAIAVIAGFWLVTLQRLVRRRTRELAERNEKLRRAYEDTERQVQERTMELAQSNQLLQAEIAEHKRIGTALQKNRMDLIAIIDNLPFLAWLKDGEGRYVAVNEPFARSCGSSSTNDLVGKTDLDVWPKHLAEGYRADDFEVMSTRQKKTLEEPVADRGVEKWFETYKAPLYDVNGKVTGTTGFARDVTERRQAEERIQASLREKETMLKEIHHRVKNNLQVISSLLGLQSSYLQDEQSRKIFQESQDRVRIIANIHTMLYQSEDLARVDFGNFIGDLVGHLQQSYAIAGSSVEVRVDVADVSLNIETSIPCGLILNELVSNALKHAFPEGRGGEVNIGMATAGNQFVLKVQDNGVGFPAAVDFLNPRSLGLELVRLLVEQINGTIDLQIKGRTTFTITFPAISKGG